MAVDLGDYIDVLKREVNPPGGEFFPDATDDEWLGNLQDAFWEAYLDGLLVAYTEADGLLTPRSGTTDITRDLVQVVVLYAGFKVLRNALRTLQTTFKATAGPVEFEQQYSANLLNSLMQDMKERRLRLIWRLVEEGKATANVIDAIQSRTDSLQYQESWFVRG